MTVSLLQHPLFLLGAYFIVGGILFLVASYIPVLKRFWYKNTPDTTEQRLIVHRFGLSSAAVFLLLGLAECTMAINLNISPRLTILWVMAGCFFLGSLIALGFLFYYRGKLTRNR